MASTDSDTELSNGVNLMSLGPDAWDDSALIEAFNQDLKMYKKAHSKNQLIDLSKVSDMISFKKAKKMNKNAMKGQPVEEEDENDEEEDNDDDDDEILAPSFVPFANQNENESQNEKINKYSSWPPVKNQGQNMQNKKKRKKKKGAESENLAKMYEEQQRKEYESQQQYQYSQAQTQAAAPSSYHQSYQHLTPPMPPYQRSPMFNMGLNMMGPPPMSSNPTRDEALSNMLLCWYWNGYYAGYTAAQGRQ